MGTEGTPWLAGPPPRRAARLRLFCFPFAGGGASAFQAWAGAMPAGVELCRVQLPGRENRFVEPLVDQIDTLLARLETALQPFLDLPYVFFGHSMGAMLAFELTRRQRANRRPLPRALLPSGHRGPHLPLRRRPWAALPEPELVAELRAIDGIPPELLAHDELLELLLPIVRSDLRLYESYVHQPDEPLPVPITAFGGAGDALVNADELRGWTDHTTGPCAVHVLPGGHFFLFQGDALRTRLARECEELLAGA